jgi:carbon-monoxide dehydrogenase small subunit
MAEQYHLHVNGARHEVADAWLGESLLYVVRERLGLLGAKGACEQGECGSCSVLVDGELVCSCLVLAASAVDQPIVTVEGLAEPGAPNDLQRAFVGAGAVQCGFCTPGLIMAAHALLDRCPDPTDTEIREQLSGNICRCTGYGRIIEAVRNVSESRSAPGGADLDSRTGGEPE